MTKEISLDWWNQVKKTAGSKHLPTLGLTPAFKKYDAAVKDLDKKPTITGCDDVIKALKALESVRVKALEAIDNAREKSKEAEKALDGVRNRVHSTLKLGIAENIKAIEEKRNQLGLDSEASKTKNPEEAKYLRLMDELLKARKVLETERSAEGFEKAMLITKACQQSVEKIMEADDKLKISYKGRLQILKATEKELIDKKQKLVTEVEQYLLMHKNTQETLKVLETWMIEQIKALTKLLPTDKPLSEEKKNKAWEALMAFEDQFWERSAIFTPGSKLRNFKFENISAGLKLEMGKVFEVTNAINKRTAQMRDKVVPLFEKACGKKAPSRV